MQPGASPVSAWKRVRASASVGVLRPVAATVPSSARENSSRVSAESRVS